MSGMECLVRERHETLAEGGETYRNGWVREEAPTARMNGAGLSASKERAMNWKHRHRSSSMKQLCDHQGTTSSSCQVPASFPM